ncbi:MAG: hypothetical protein IPO04_16295 [Cytophagaceae bacterium]|nr:hypothetical protein [Cytophagaceae bacterium]
MKKYFTSNEYKKRNTKWAAVSLKQRLKSDAKLNVKRKKNVGLKKDERKKKRIDETFINKKAPPNFSFVENTEAVLQYLEDLKTLFKRKQNVMINLRDVTNLTNDAIVLLLSFVKTRRL